MIFWQIVAIAVVAALVLLLVLTFIAPGPLVRRPPRQARRHIHDDTGEEQAS